MPSTRARKPPETPGPILKESIELAEAFCKSNPKISVRHAASKFGVSSSTLQERINGRPSRKAAATRRQRLLPAEEDVIAEFTLGLADMGFPVSIRRLRQQANHILQARDPNAKPIGVNWHRRFLDRHPEVQSQWSRGLDRTRVAAAEPQSFQQYFELLCSIFIDKQIGPSNVFNMDEKSVMLGLLKRDKVLVRKGQVASVTQDGSRKSITVIEWICADGTAGRPTYIYPAQRLEEAWFVDDTLNANYARSSNGWTDNELGVEWLKLFDAETQDKADQPRLLILDGHASHVSFEFIEYARKSNIILLCLPSHSTNETQPLDLVVFEPLSHAWSEEVTKESAIGAVNLSTRDFARMYSVARPKAFTEKLILKAFEAAGIIPFNPDRVSGSRNAPLRATDNNRIPAQPSQLVLEMVSSGSEDTMTDSEDAAITLDEITAALHLDTSDSPTAQYLQGALQRTRDELAASAAREVLTGNRVQEMEEARSRRKDGSRRQIGGARILTSDVIRADIVAARQKKKDKAAEKERNRLKRERRKREKALEDIQKEARKEERLKRRQEKEAETARKRAARAAKKAAPKASTGNSKKGGKGRKRALGKENGPPLVVETPNRPLRRSRRLEKGVE